MLLFINGSQPANIGTTRPDHTVLRSLVALLASLPATENTHFREEFDTVMFISARRFAHID